MAEIKHTRITSTNDSDAVVLTAGANKLIEILGLQVAFTSTATAGNRQLVITIQDDSDAVVFNYSAGAVQAASLTRSYSFGRGTFRETAFVDGKIMCPIAFGTVLLPAWDLRVADSAGVDAAADDMTIDIVYRETSAGPSAFNSAGNLIA